MTLNITPPDPAQETDFLPKIKIVGVGGGGTNAINNMIMSNLQGVDFIAANTDTQNLADSMADTKIQLGPAQTQGLGAGANPEVGRASAEEVEDQISQYLDGAHMVFITTGMGGGTGTGAAPVIARIARDKGILTIGVVSKPFDLEGKRRAQMAEDGIAELQNYVDTLIVIPNQNLFFLANENTTLREAYRMVDQVLTMGVRGITDLMVKPGYVNLDFADIRSIMGEMGKAMMGTGEAEGEDRAIKAAESAISNPLLEDTCIKTAKGLLVNVTGGADDMTLQEYAQAAERIKQEVPEDVNFKVGNAFDESMTGKIRVSVVATGIDLDSNAPQKVRSSAESEEGDAPAPAAPQASVNRTESTVEETQSAQPCTPQQRAEETRSQQQPPPASAAPRQAVRQPEKSPHARLFSEAPRPQPRGNGGGFFGNFFRRKTQKAAPQPVEVSRSEENEEQQKVDNVPAFLRRR